MKSFTVLDGNGRLDRRVGVVIEQFKIFEGETVDLFDCRIDAHPRSGSGVAGELLLGLLYMVGVEVEVTKSMDELVRL